MATVTFKRIDLIYGNLTEIVNDPTPRSELSEEEAEEQDRLLAKSCGQVCGLLKDWLTSDVWNGMRAPVGGSAADFPEYQERLGIMLPTLQDVLERASGHMKDVRPELVGQAHKALEAVAIRHQELFKKAENTVSELRENVCKLADQLRDHNASDAKKTLARANAKRLLTNVLTLLPTLVIAMASVAPSQVPINLRQWERAAVTMVTIQDIAAMAERPSWQRAFTGKPLVTHKAPDRSGGRQDVGAGRTRTPHPEAGKRGDSRGRGEGPRKGQRPPPTGRS